MKNASDIVSEYKYVFYSNFNKLLGVPATES